MWHVAGDRASIASRACPACVNAGSPSTARRKPSNRAQRSNNPPHGNITVTSARTIKITPRSIMQASLPNEQVVPAIRKR